MKIVMIIKSNLNQFPFKVGNAASLDTGSDVTFEQSQVWKI